MRVTEIAPIDVPIGVFKGVKLLFYLLEITAYLILKVGSSVIACREPTVLIKCYGSEEYLTSEVVIRLPDMYLSETECEDMPVAVPVTDKVAVTDALNDGRSFVSVGEHGVMCVIFKFSPNRI